LGSSSHSAALVSLLQLRVPVVWAAQQLPPDAVARPRDGVAQAVGPGDAQRLPQEAPPPDEAEQVALGVPPRLAHSKLPNLGATRAELASLPEGASLLRALCFRWAQSPDSAMCFPPLPKGQQAFGLRPACPLQAQASCLGLPPRRAPSAPQALSRAQ